LNITSLEHSNKLYIDGLPDIIVRYDPSKTVTMGKLYRRIYGIFQELMNQDRIEHYSIKTAKFLSYLMPKKQREEWFGDVMEARSELKRDSESRLFIEAVTYGRIIILILNSIAVYINELVHARKTSN